MNKCLLRAERLTYFVVFASKSFNFDKGDPYESDKFPMFR